MENLERRRESNAIIFKILEIRDLSKWCLSRSKKKIDLRLFEIVIIIIPTGRGGEFFTQLLEIV